ncbi:MAG: hypothetical protein U0271_04820 [Polyangiaceae bacterium]
MALEDTANNFGLLLFVADWLRSPAFRRELNSSDLQYSEAAEKLRSDYLLDDRDVGIVAARHRPALIERLVEILQTVDLDTPPPWDPSTRRAPQTSALRAAVGWPGAAIVCLETVSVNGNLHPQLLAGQAASLELTGWNVGDRATFGFVAESGETIKAEDIVIATDAVGRSRATVEIALPIAGLWSVALLDRGTARSSLVDAIEVLPS